MNELSPRAKMLRASMFCALYDNHDVWYKDFMCYMRNVPQTKGDAYYKARQELIDANIIKFYRSSPSIYLINPDCVPWFSKRKRTLVKRDMQAVDLAFKEHSYTKYWVRPIKKPVTR